MKTHKQNFKLTAISLALSLATTNVFAAEETQKEKEEKIERVVVTGTLSGSMTRLDAPFSVTTMYEEDIKRFNPTTSADLTNSIPGVFTETAFGNAGAATRVRGLSVGDGNLATFSFNGAPVFAVNAMEGIEQAGLVRYDDTVERVEAVIGGISAITGQGQPGVNSNYILKQGDDESEGLIRYNITDFGSNRVDALFSGELNDDLYYMIGGYVESGTDFRDAEYNSGGGHQLTINITKHFENGEISAFVRNLEDNSAYSLFTPVSQSLGNFSNFDASTDTLLSQDLRFHDVAINANGDTKIYDMKDGRSTDIVVTGLNADFDLANDWTLRNNLSYTSGTTGNVFLVPLWARPADGEGTLGDLIGPRAGAGGTATVISSGRVMDGDELIYQSRVWIQDTEIESFTNDLSFGKEFDSHEVVFGVYTSSYNVSTLQNRGTNIFHTVEKNAQRVELVQANGDSTSNGQSTYFGYGPANTQTAEGQSLAFYLADTWTVNDALKVDIGFRHESAEIRTTLDQWDDSNPLVTLPNGIGVRVQDGITDSINEYDDSELSWTVGGNYTLSETSSVFARITDGHLMPQPQNVTFNALTEAGSLFQAEVGYKLITDSLEVFATFYTLEFEAPTVSSVEGVIFREKTTTEVTGLDIDATYRLGNFEMRVIAGYSDGEFAASTNPDEVGKELARVPQFTFRASPSYIFELGDETELVVYGAIQAFGERWANTTNTGNKIPSYQTYDLGTSLNFGQVNINLAAKNLTDEIGLTEGTPQQEEAVTPFVVVVPGRMVKLSVSYNF